MHRKDQLRQNFSSLDVWFISGREEIIKSCELTMYDILGILTHIHLVRVGCHTVAKKPVNHPESFHLAGTSPENSWTALNMKCYHFLTI
jgi:hypothetical protein